MLDLSTQFGRHVNRRLREEQVIWLITTDAQHRPQPRPVWFHWDGRTVLIFSERNTAKLRHIAANPRVALNFNTDADGGDVAVLLGEASILAEPPASGRIQAYLKKYRAGIKDLGMTPTDFTKAFVVPTLVTPQSMRES